MSALTGDRLSLQLSKVWLVWLYRDPSKPESGTYLGGVFSTHEKASEAIDSLESEGEQLAGEEQVKLNEIL